LNISTASIGLRPARDLRAASGLRQNRSSRDRNSSHGNTAVIFMASYTTPWDTIQRSGQFFEVSYNGNAACRHGSSYRGRTGDGDQPPESPGTTDAP